MPTLERITIRGYKSIAAIEGLELRPINLLIGANGSGKSNFIEVFAFLRMIRDGRLQEAVVRAGGANRVLHYGAKATPQISIEVDFADVNRYELALLATVTDELLPVLEQCWFKDDLSGKWTPRRLSSASKEAAISDSIETEPIAKQVREWLQMWRVYHFHDVSPASPLKRSAQVNDNAYFREDGANLPSILMLLKQMWPAQYELIERTVRLVAPFFGGFILRPNPLNTEMVRLEWSHTRSESYFDASAFSDGTLRFIALAVLLLLPPALKPSVILIDEPELGLHPYAIEVLSSLIRQASIETQVIVSTQSALLLDHFEPEDILVAGRENGATVMKRLDASRVSQWLDEYSLGQLWEKNELGGRPTAD